MEEHNDEELAEDTQDNGPDRATIQGSLTDRGMIQNFA
jgi:hypothetical protein